MRSQKTEHRHSLYRQRCARKGLNELQRCDEAVHASAGLGWRSNQSETSTSATSGSKGQVQCRAGWLAAAVSLAIIRKIGCSTQSCPRMTSPSTIAGASCLCLTITLSLLRGTGLFSK